MISIIFDRLARRTRCPALRIRLLTEAVYNIHQCVASSSRVLARTCSGEPSNSFTPGSINWYRLWLGVEVLSAATGTTVG